MRARPSPLWACAAVSAAALLATSTAPAGAALAPWALGVLHDVWGQTGGPQGYWTGPCAVGWGVGDPCDPSTQWNASGCIVCNDAGNDVTKLLLEQTNLTGTIPPSLGDLTALAVLNLGSNRLTGTIPSSLGNLTALTQLGLAFNQLTGSIPSSFGNLIALTSLGLSFNTLTGTVPSWLGNLTALRELGLSSNQLTGIIPPSLGNLAALTELGLSSNQLTGIIPPSLGNLITLMKLVVSSNQLTGTIPSSIGNLTALTGLNLNSNQLTGTIPLSLGNLTALTQLSIGSNHLTGAIPPSLGSLTALMELDLSSNQLTGTVPSWLGNLTALTYLGTHSNQLTGTIPPSIGNLTALAVLGLSSNRLTGTIPSSFGYLTTLMELSLNSNRLTGTIPSSFGNLTSLTVLSLSSNQLMGAIPPWLGNLTALTQLLLGNNQLTGTIPSSLGNLTALIALGLSANGLTGAIPSSLGNLTAMVALLLANNQLTGPVPSWLGNLTALTELALDSNQLTGSVPSSLGNLTALTELDLNHNHLKGTIPPSLGSLTALVVLSLSFNELTGAIPSSFGNLTALTSLGLSSNTLTGTVPLWLGSLTALTELALGSNQLTGTIPPSLGNLTALIGLSLNSNQLTGTIPSSLGNLLSLANLTIGDNAGITGTVPRWICNMTQLQTLILERTAVAGSLPTCLHRLTQLLELDLRGLRLTGALTPSLFTLPQLRFLLVSGADFSGGLPQFACLLSNTSATSHVTDTCLTSGTAAATQSGAGVTVGPQLRMIALVACGLSGEIPSWVGRLPNITAIDLSGNDLSGQFPTFAAGTPLTQFVAANNRLTGTLDALQHATLLVRLNVHSNEVGGAVGDWLGNRSSQMTELVVTENDLSCELPPTTRIKARDNASSDDEDATLSVLSGNVFSCPVPAGVEDNDSGADDYVCGSSDLTFAGAFFGVAVAVATAVAVWIVLTSTASSTVVDADVSPTGTVTPAATAADTPERLLTWLLLAIALLLAVAVLPMYSTARAVLECRYGWSTTAAFLAPGAWGATVTVVGGLVGGGLVVSSLVAVGTAGGVVRVHSARWSVAAWQIARAVLIYAVVLCLLVLLNAAFVLLEESPHASGSAKHAIVVVFAVLHEIVDHAVTPLIVSAVVVAAAGRGRSLSGGSHSGTSRAERIQGAQVLVATVAVELANSVVAPVIAQLGVSEGCYRDLLFGSSVSTTTTAQMPFCAGNNWPNKTSCESGGFVWTNYTISVTYKPPFRFDSGRCISSIITLYTPEYLVIFALRVLLYPLAWWLARRRTPWVVAGVQPPVWLRSAFVETRRRVMSVVGCCSGPGPNSVKDYSSIGPTIDAGDSYNDVELSPAYALSRGDGVLEALHATEPTTHVFNLLAIAMCPGMFSPVVAVAAVGSVAFKHLWEWCLDRRSTAQSDAATQPNEVQHAAHALPAMCVAMLLLLHSVYLVVLLSTAETEWARWTAVGVNWAAFGATCWLCDGARGATGDFDEGPSVSSTGARTPSGVSNGSFELTERLLPAEAGVIDSDE